MVCVCGAKAKGKLYWEVYNFQQAIKNTTSSPRLPLLAMLFLLRLKDLWKGERDKYNSHHKYPYAAGRLAGRQLFQLIYTHVCVCVCVLVCVAGWELAAAGRAKRVCKMTAVLSLCSRRQTGGEGKQAWQMYLMHTRHTCHTCTPRSPPSLASFLRHFAVCLRQGEL